MKALVLSGGAGTRPGPITHTSAERPVPSHGWESLADAVGAGPKSGPQVTRVVQGDPPGPARALLTVRIVRHPVDSRADARRTVIRGHGKDTGDVVDPPEADRSVRTPCASDAPGDTAPDELIRAGTLDDLELGRPRPESAHGDGRDADLPAPARHRSQGRPDGVRDIGGTELTDEELTGPFPEACGAGRGRVEHVEDREDHAPHCPADRTEAGDELGHRPRHRFTAGLAETVARHRDHRARREPLERRGAGERA
ncbi:hypothetical protein [Streptomyces sp. enrichment culture]|uniref:hypothetical protein n=1 Tax=Streptomyces sp. enrichment culture TaxID=1795815 RepID=UPI003F5598EB